MIPTPARFGGAAASLGVLLLLATAGPAQGQQDSSEEDEAEGSEAVLAGLYTAAQAERGLSVFHAHCSACHLPSQFRGATFRATWGGRTAYDLVDQLRATMPMDNPGGLVLQAYVDVVAYLLRLNRYREGEAELPTEAESLRAARIPPDDGDG